MSKRVAIFFLLIIAIGLARVCDAETPEQSVAALANFLNANDIDSALKYVAPAEQADSRQMFTSMDEAKRKQFAASLLQVTVKENTGDACTVSVPLQTSNGTVVDADVSLVPDGHGGWAISSW
jgi:hypothetical protein